MILAMPRGELAFTFQGGTLGRGRHGGGGHHGGGGFRRGGGFYSVSYPSTEYVAPVVLVAPTPACSTFPNPPPACAGGTLVWQDAKTVCCR
jgi:hypothetical protein